MKYGRKHCDCLQKRIHPSLTVSQSYHLDGCDHSLVRRIHRNCPFKILFSDRNSEALSPFSWRWKCKYEISIPYCSYPVTIKDLSMETKSDLLGIQQMSKANRSQKNEDSPGQTIPEFHLLLNISDMKYVSQIWNMWVSKSLDSLTS